VEADEVNNVLFVIDYQDAAHVRDATPTSHSPT
jgi:hypothetical protein